MKISKLFHLLLTLKIHESRVNLSYMEEGPTVWGDWLEADVTGWEHQQLQLFIKSSPSKASRSAAEVQAVLCRHCIFSLCFLLPSLKGRGDRGARLAVSARDICSFRLMSQQSSSRNLSTQCPSTERKTESRARKNNLRRKQLNLGFHSNLLSHIGERRIWALISA